MINQDRILLQDIQDIQNGPFDADARVLARIVESLCQRVDALEQRIKAVMEQQGLSTTKLGKLDRTVETLIEEQMERLPVEGKDFLGDGPEHFHTPDSQACYGKDCFTAVPAEAERPCERGCTVEMADAACPVHGVKAFLRATFAAEASVDADQAVKP